MKPPRNLFRSRQRPAYASNVIEAPSKAQLRRGTFTEVRVWHRHDCPRPRGGLCTCKPYEIDVEVVDQERS
jgi:hypothetical protein